VVAKEKQSERQVRDTRALFWYREELLNGIQATWREVCGLTERDMEPCMELIGIAWIVEEWGIEFEGSGGGCWDG
jgi:hypothetical protein